MLLARPRANATAATHTTCPHLPAVPRKVAFWLPFALFFVVQADWSFVLVVGDIYFPWLVPLLYALPVWRSPTDKLRTFAGAGDFAATRRLLGGGDGTHAARGARSRLGTQLRRAVDFRRGGKADDRAQLAVVKRLLAAGADPDITDGEGQSALHQMVQVGHVATARALLEAGADPNLRDESGKAALHYAVGDVGGYRPQPAAVSLLLEDSWGTDPSLVRDSGNWRCYSLYGQVQTAFMAARGQDARSLLMPKPGWDAVAAALNANTGGGAAAAAVLALLPSKRRGLRALQLLDLLWDRALEPDAVARVARRRLIFDRLIAPLVRDAPARKLGRVEKELLIHACKATAGPEQALGRPTAREGHRAAFGTMLKAVMDQFAVQLDSEYATLGAMPGGMALFALYDEEMLHCVTKECSLRQDLPAVAGQMPCVGADAGADGDLGCAFRSVLKPSGAVDSPGALCALLQGGRNPELFSRSFIKHFHSAADTTAFWRHVCSLQSMARHKVLNDEFHHHIKTALDGVAGAHFKDAPLKGYERIAMKAQEYHWENGFPDSPQGASQAAACVIDIVRCSFEVPSAQSALELVAWFDAATMEEHGVLALRRKNGFHPDAPSAGGYRDVKYNLLFQSPTIPGAFGRAIVEVQIIVEAYLNVKKKMHAVYRIDRGDFG